MLRRNRHDRTVALPPIRLIAAMPKREQRTLRERREDLRAFQAASIDVTNDRNDCG